MKPKPNIIGQLRHAINNSGQSLYRIAKQTSVDQSVMNRFARGERSVSLDTAARIASYLELDLVPRRDTGRR
jgi:transcriptional regulator with XRE-family HTH domain